MRKNLFEVFGQFRHKSGLTATDDRLRFENRYIIL